MTKSVCLSVFIVSVAAVLPVCAEDAPNQLKCTVVLETRDDRTAPRMRKAYSNRRAVGNSQSEDPFLFRTALGDTCGPILRQCRDEGTRVYGEAAFAAAGVRFACRVTYLDFEGCRVSYEGIDGVRLLQSDAACASGKLYRALRDENREQSNLARAFYSRYCAGRVPACE